MKQDRVKHLSNKRAYPLPQGGRGAQPQTAQTAGPQQPAPAAPLNELDPCFDAQPDPDNGHYCDDPTTDGAPGAEQHSTAAAGPSSAAASQGQATADACAGDAAQGCSSSSRTYPGHARWHFQHSTEPTAASKQQQQASGPSRAERNASNWGVFVQQAVGSRYHQSHEERTSLQQQEYEWRSRQYSHAVSTGQCPVCGLSSSNCLRERSVEVAIVDTTGVYHVQVPLFACSR
jgi:hypothetical protein